MEKEAQQVGQSLEEIAISVTDSEQLRTVREEVLEMDPQTRLSQYRVLLGRIKQYTITQQKGFQDMLLQMGTLISTLLSYGYWLENDKSISLLSEGFGMQGLESSASIVGAGGIAAAGGGGGGGGGMMGTGLLNTIRDQTVGWVRGMTLVTIRHVCLLIMGLILVRSLWHVIQMVIWGVDADVGVAVDLDLSTQRSVLTEWLIVFFKVAFGYLVGVQAVNWMVQHGDVWIRAILGDTLFRSYVQVLADWIWSRLPTNHMTVLWASWALSNQLGKTILQWIWKHIGWSFLISGQPLDANQQEGFIAAVNQGVQRVSAPRQTRSPYR